MTRVPQATSCWTEGQWVTDLVTVTPRHGRDSLRVTGFLISSLMARLLAEVRRPASSLLQGLGALTPPHGTMPRWLGCALTRGASAPAASGGSETVPHPV